MKVIRKAIEENAKHVSRVKSF